MMPLEEQAILRGAIIAALAIEELKGATLGRCEGRDITGDTERHCASTGVLIATGYRCPKHGYERGYTPPVTRAIR